ncbi:MAG: hypothetical protein ABSD96_22650 [Candidatus Korobacteraceae bacterium]
MGYRRPRVGHRWPGVGYRRPGADVTRATATGTHTAAGTCVPAATTTRMAATTGVTPTTRMTTAAFRRGRVSRGRQRRRENKDGNPEFEFRHDVARSVGTFVVSPNVLKPDSPNRRQPAAGSILARGRALSRGLRFVPIFDHP